MKRSWAAVWVLVVSAGWAAGAVAQTDSCVNAAAIGPGTHAGTTIGASNDGSGCIAAADTSADVWYALTPAQSGVLTLETCGSGFDTVVSVHSACPGSGANVLVCNDDACANYGSRVQVDGVAGQRYLVRIAGWQGQTGAYSLVVGGVAPPGPDGCASAATIAPGTYQSTTTGATNDGAASCGQSNTSPDTWYRYVAGAETGVTVETCGSAYDTVVSVHRGCPGGIGNEVVCNDDTGGACGVGATVRFTAAAGESFVIRVGGYNGASGAFTLRLTEGPPPPPPASGADAYIGELGAMVQIGRLGDTVGCATDTPLCNAGSVPLDSITYPDPRHPMFVFNMYRQRAGGGRFEQIGQSWVKHMQSSAQQDACGLGCAAHPTGLALGVGCSDTYGATYNGTQSIMGPRTEVNPWTGVFAAASSHLATPNVPPHTAISHRLQLRDGDLDPTQNAGAVYYVEQYTVTHDDVNHMNSVAHERVSPAGAPGGTWALNIGGAATANGPAMMSWAQGPGVTRTTIPSDTPAAPEESRPDAVDGRCILGVSATDNGNGTWHYEYALYNHDMDRGVQRFSIPLRAGTAVTNIGFSAVRSHDEGAFDNAPWTAVRTANGVTWATAAFGSATSNPVRWGTLYNFWFDGAAGPGRSRATLGMFKPGVTGEVNGETRGPGLCAADFNLSGDVSVQDIFNYLAAFFAGDSEADFNAGGGVSVQDLFDFLGAFFGGCV